MYPGSGEVSMVNRGSGADGKGRGLPNLREGVASAMGIAGISGRTIPNRSFRTRCHTPEARCSRLSRSTRRRASSRTRWDEVGTRTRAGGLRTNTAPVHRFGELGPSCLARRRRSRLPASRAAAYPPTPGRHRRRSGGRLPPSHPRGRPRTRRRGLVRRGAGGRGGERGSGSPARGLRPGGSALGHDLVADHPSPPPACPS